METVTKLANKSVSQKHTREIHYKIPRLFNAPEREQLYEVHGANKFLKLGIAAFGLDALVALDDEMVWGKHKETLQKSKM